MLKKLLVIAVSSGLLLSSVPSFAEDDLNEFRSQLNNEWQLVKNDRMRSLKTYARLEDGKRYRSFKVEAILNTPIESVARVLLDFDRYTRWFWKTRESKLIRQGSPTEYFVYMIHDAPYGLPDRDTVIKATVEPQTKTKHYVTLKVTAIPNMMPEKPPLVRMLAEEINLKFTPISENKVEMVTEGYFDPGGVVPAWAANFVQRSAPYAVMLALQRMTEKEEYLKAKTPLPFPLYNFSDYK
jgi:hypothetical protein